jgi:hypothetical protein
VFFIVMLLERFTSGLTRSPQELVPFEYLSNRTVNLGPASGRSLGIPGGSCQGAGFACRRLALCAIVESRLIAITADALRYYQPCNQPSS